MAEPNACVPITLLRSWLWTKQFPDEAVTETATTQSTGQC